VRCGPRKGERQRLGSAQRNRLQAHTSVSCRPQKPSKAQKRRAQKSKEEARAQTSSGGP